MNQGLIQPGERPLRVFMHSYPPPNRSSIASAHSSSPYIAIHTDHIKLIYEVYHGNVLKLRVCMIVRMGCFLGSHPTHTVVLCSI